MRVCTKCKVEKSPDSFDKCSRAKDGLQSRCKDCKKAYREANKEKILESKRRYRKQNRDKVLKSQKEHYSNNRESILEKRRELYKQNPEKYREKNREYKYKNRKKSIEYNRRYESERMKRDPVFAMKKRVRHAMQLALIRKGFVKRQRTIDALGCTAEEFKIHIEKQFTKGMSWDNREKWHLDHIIPISSASTEDEIYALSHFTNIRPMWARDNRRKSNKITKLL